MGAGQLNNKLKLLINSVSPSGAGDLVGKRHLSHKFLHCINDKTLSELLIIAAIAILAAL